MNRRRNEHYSNLEFQGITRLYLGRVLYTSSCAARADACIAIVRDSYSTYIFSARGSLSCSFSSILAECDCQNAGIISPFDT
uniref:Uncharacterized protein n=1 Tax=Trichogramma kaykai TaxID=54128 RepID=A0ABD2WIT6_9HYME